MVHIFSLPLYVRVEKNLDDFLENSSEWSDDEIRFLEACNVPIRMFGHVSDVHGSRMTVRYHDDSRSLDTLEKNMFRHYESAYIKHVNEVKVGEYYVFREACGYDPNYYRVKVVQKDFIRFTLLAVDYGFVRSVRCDQLNSFFEIDPTFYEGHWHFAMAAVIHEPDASQMNILGLPRFSRLVGQEQLTGDVFFLSPFEPMCGAFLPFDVNADFDMKKLVDGDVASQKWIEACLASSDTEHEPATWNPPPLHPFKHKNNTVAATVVNVESNLEIHVRDMLTSMRLICLEEIFNEMYDPKKDLDWAKIDDENDLHPGDVLVSYDEFLQRFYRVKITQKCPGFCANVVGLDYPICKQNTVPYAELFYLNGPLSQLPIMYQEFTIPSPILKKGLPFAEIMVRELIPSGSVVGIHKKERLTFFYEDAIRDLELTLSAVKGLVEPPEHPTNLEERPPRPISASSSTTIETRDIICVRNDYVNKVPVLFSDVSPKNRPCSSQSTSGYGSTNCSDPNPLYLSALPPSFQRVYCSNVGDDGTVLLRTEKNVEVVKKLQADMLAELQAQRSQPFPRFEWKYLTDQFVVMADGEVRRGRFEPDGQCLFVDYDKKIVLDKTHKLFEIPEAFAKQPPLRPAKYNLFSFDSHLKMTSGTSDLIMSSVLYAELPAKRTSNPIRLVAKQTAHGKTTYVDVTEYCRISQTGNAPKTIKREKGVDSRPVIMF